MPRPGKWFLKTYVSFPIFCLSKTFTISSPDSSLALDTSCATLGISRIRFTVWILSGFKGTLASISVIEK